MANYTTAEDLIDDALDRAKEPTDGTSEFNSQALRFLNRAYLGIISGGSELDPNISEIWHWLKTTEASLILTPRYNTGTISLTNNSASATLSASPTDSLAGRFFKATKHADVFKISSHNAGATPVTLDSVYTGDTDTEATFQVFQVDYDLASDVLYPLTFQAWQDNHREIVMMDLQDLSKTWPLHLVDSGVPTAFAMIDEQKIRFNRFGGQDSTDLIRIDYSYIKQPDLLTDSDTSIPEVPHQYRKVLADWTYAYLLEMKEDNRAATAAALARSGLLAMAKDNRRRMQFSSGDTFGKIMPRPTNLERYLRPLRTENGYIIG